MKIALVDANPKSKLYNVGLLKIGTWRKSLGDFCKLFVNTLPRADEFDEIWISTIFTFNIPYHVKLARQAQKLCSRVLVGGIACSLLPEYFEGIEIHKGLLPQAENCTPDYTLLDRIPKYSITHTSRGCVNKCGFCMVSKLEPEFTYRNWQDDIHKASTKILFYDNNWLAKPDLWKSIEQIKQVTASGRITEIDFNQALDCRLMTDEIADSLIDLPFKWIRFAFDGMQENGYCQESIKMMVERGHKRFMIFCLYNWKDTPQDFYYRLRETHRLSQELNCQVVAFPMRYQPILEIDEKREHIGIHWTKQLKHSFASSLMYAGAIKGQLSLFGKKGVMTPLENFEYWYGRNVNEFVDILNQNNIREYWRFKQGILQAHLSNAPRSSLWDNAFKIAQNCLLTKN